LPSDIDTASSVDSQDTTKSLVNRIYKNSVLRYLAVGGTSFIVDFGLLYFFHEVLGVRLWISTGVAFLASFLFNFTFQKIFAFSSKSHSGWSLVKYLALVAFNTLATVAIVSLLYTFIGWELAKVLATVLTTIWNYLAYRFIVYTDTPFFLKKKQKVSHV